MRINLQVLIALAIPRLYVMCETFASLRRYYPVQVVRVRSKMVCLNLSDVLPWRLFSFVNKYNGSEEICQEEKEGECFVSEYRSE